MKRFSTSDCPWESSSHDAEIRKQTLLKYGEMPGLTQFCLAELASGQEVEAHSHSDMYEVFFILEGSLDFSVDFKRFALTAGDAVLIFPKERHFLENTNTETARFLILGIEVGSDKD